MWSFLRDKGFIIMMIGFALALVSLVAYMQVRNYAGWPSQLSFGGAIAGFSLYVAGRILVAIDRNLKKKRR